MIFSCLLNYWWRNLAHTCIFIHTELSWSAFVINFWNSCCWKLLMMEFWCWAWKVEPRISNKVQIVPAERLFRETLSFALSWSWRVVFNKVQIVPAERLFRETLSFVYYPHSPLFDLSCLGLYKDNGFSSFSLFCYALSFFFLLFFSFFIQTRLLNITKSYTHTLGMQNA
jgi:hypothetical protein